MPNWGQISGQLHAATGVTLIETSVRSVGGGCISSAFAVDGAVEGDKGSSAYFIKINRAENLAMFEAEQQGLHELAKSDGLRIPAALHCDISGNDAYLVMEHVSLKAAGDDESLGKGLAALHRIDSQEGQHGDLQQPSRAQFGWHRDNTIGSIPQCNEWEDDWVQFWAEHRLGYQLRLAAEKGAGQAFIRRGEKLQAELSVFFTDYQPVASLLHGDLWSGNYAFDENGRPVIFDPAVYFGDREADLAMTELFGGFSANFYAAYNNTWPLDTGYATRKTLYNLYHILNHFNLFGGGYLSQAQSMVDGLLAEC